MCQKPKSVRTVRESRLGSHVAEAGKPNVIVYSIVYTPERCSSRFGFSPHTTSQRQRLPTRPRLRAINPGLVSSGQLCNNILFYLFCMTTRVDRIGRNTQPIDGCVVRGGTVMATRNKHHLIFTSTEVISNNEVMPITFQCGAGFRNKESRISLELINKKVDSVNQPRYADISIDRTLNETMNPSGVHSSTSGFNILGT
jgi:hypothetical protein